VPRLQRKNFATPDQVRTFATGRMDIVNLLLSTLAERAAHARGRAPPYRVAPITGTRSCQHRHLGYAISGSLGVRMDDGTELTIGPGDAYEIPPGHDAWVIGDEPWNAVEFASAHAFGCRPRSSASACSRPSCLPTSSAPRR
jgi:hypothetical protein